MFTKYLIYPMVISDHDFDLIKGSCTVLKNMNFDRLTSLVNCKQSVVYHLAQAVLDLEEVISNHNGRGYRYNSFVLNMAAIKLTFVLEILIAKNECLFETEINTLRSVIMAVQLILQKSYELFIIEHQS